MQPVVGCIGALVQLSVSAKSPLAVMLVNVSAVEPWLVAVSVCGAEVVPTGTEPKLRLEAESVSEEVVPVRFMDWIWGLPSAV